LPWSVFRSCGGNKTKELLNKAVQKSQAFGFYSIPKVTVDNETENVNAEKGGMIRRGIISRVIAQIEIDFSNALIEALFYRFKYRHLFLQQMTSLDILVKQTDFYLTEANNKIPLTILAGATALELISGQWTTEATEAFKDISRHARADRILIRRDLAC